MSMSKISLTNRDDYFHGHTMWPKNNRNEHMKFLSLFFFSCFIFSQSFSQTYDPAKVNKRAIVAYTQAIANADDGKYEKAIFLFQQSILAENRYVDAYLSLAGVYGQLKKHDSSILFYEKAFLLDSVYTAGYYLPYSINLAGLGKFEKALDAVNYVLSKRNLNPNTIKSAEYRKISYEFAVDFEKKNDYKNYIFTPLNLGDSINSAESEYFPSLTIDGDELVFTRRVKNMNEDFYSSNKKNNQWGKAKPLPGNINTEQNEGAQIISADGNWLVFTGCNRPDGQGGCDIFISYKTQNGWSPATNLGAKVNSDQWESHPCLSPDKRELYFSSTRFGGFGGSDLYVCRLQSNGRWSEPENLGPQINTKGNEASPFIHVDNQTLYFTSSGLPGYGDDDLFICRRGPNGVWSNPVNLGYPINTINREGTLFVAADGKTAYLSSDRSVSKGGMDIFSFDLRENVRPYKTLWIKGQVFDAKTSKGISSTAELTDVGTKALITKVQTNEDGTYLITLPIGKDYAFNVNKKGYLFYSENFSLKNISPDSTYEKNIPLQSLEINASTVLKNIFFDVNSFELKTESQAELDKLIQLLHENPALKIQISGHTDNIGSVTNNQKLSENRAKSVITYLLANKIEQSRLSYTGFGETIPLESNLTEDGRSKNRRTEMQVMAN